jgi:hypothetical protein
MAIGAKHANVRFRNLGQVGGALLPLFLLFLNADRLYSRLLRFRGLLRVTPYDNGGAMSMGVFVGTRES